MKRKICNPNPQVKKLSQIDKKLSYKETEVEIEKEIEELEDERTHPLKKNPKK